MEKIQDYLHEWVARNGAVSQCRIRVFQNKEYPDSIKVIATEAYDPAHPAHNPGNSITNSAELIATQISQLFHNPISTWIEHYIRVKQVSLPNEELEEFSLVNFNRSSSGV